MTFGGSLYIRERLIVGQKGWYVIKNVALGGGLLGECSPSSFSSNGCHDYCLEAFQTCLLHPKGKTPESHFPSPRKDVRRDEQPAEQAGSAAALISGTKSRQCGVCDCAPDSGSASAAPFTPHSQRLRCVHYQVGRSSFGDRAGASAVPVPPPPPSRLPPFRSAASLFRISFPL